jgi:predicted nucleotidyltransferase
LPAEGNAAMDENIRLAVCRAAEAVKELGAREVYVFGSAAKGTMREGSDIDFAVAGLPPQLFFDAMVKIADIVKREIDLVDLDVDGPFTQYLRKKGRLLRVG